VRQGRGASSRAAQLQRPNVVRVKLVDGLFEQAPPRSTMSQQDARETWWTSQFNRVSPSGGSLCLAHLRQIHKTGRPCSSTTPTHRFLAPVMLNQTAERKKPLAFSANLFRRFLRCVGRERGGRQGAKGGQANRRRKNEGVAALVEPRR